MSAILFVWVRPGRVPPAGFTFTGVVSLWPHTGAVRAELWEGAE